MTTHAFLTKRVVAHHAAHYLVAKGASAAIIVTLLNDERPPIWEQVSDWIDRNGPIANSDLCGIARVDTLKASRMFKRWVDQGLLVPDAVRDQAAFVRASPVWTTGRRDKVGDQDHALNSQVRHAIHPNVVT